MVLKGRAFVFGDNINTDLIIPGRYLHLTDPQELKWHAMEDADSEFASKIKEGDLLVAGDNFGCGSSREQAVICLKQLGLSAVVARSFARIFYRNAINLGLPVLVCPVGTEGIKDGDEVQLDLESNELLDISSSSVYRLEPLPDPPAQILADGGLIPYLKKRLAEDEGR